MDEHIDRVVQQRLSELVRRVDPVIGKVLDNFLERYDEAIQFLILTTRDTYES